MIRMELVSNSAQLDSSLVFMSARGQLQKTERFQMSSVKDAIRKDFTGILSIAQLDIPHPTLDIVSLHAQRELVMLDI